MKNSFMQFTYIAICTAILAILAQLTIPLPLIPITGQSLAIALIATIFTCKIAMGAVCLYLGMGMVGIPVFAGFTSGLGILFGPTGGYLWSFLLMALIISLIVHQSKLSFTISFLANLVGMVINLIAGSLWLAYYLDLPMNTAFATGFIPFFIVGIVKAFIATTAGLQIKKRMAKARLLLFV